MKLYSIYLFSCSDKVQNSDLLVKQLGLIGIKVIWYWWKVTFKEINLGLIDRHNIYMIQYTEKHELKR